MPVGRAGSSSLSEVLLLGLLGPVGDDTGDGVGLVGSLPLHLVLTKIVAGVQSGSRLAVVAQNISATLGSWLTSQQSS
jgi:hypothetical protein